MKKPLLLAFVLALIGLFFLLDLQRYFTLEELKDNLSVFTAWRDAHPVLASAIFFAVYVAVTALSLPGAAVMTLAAGAMFGFLWGLVLVSFASSVGALLAFLLGRYIFREAVQSRFGSRLKTFNEGMRRDGAFYLFSLRLVPVFPFFVINLLMALTAIKAWTFYWVSQLGMLLGTMVYVNAGTQLAQIDRLSEVASPALLLSFLLLALFPLLARYLLRQLQRRRVYARWRRPRRFDRNLLVIGGGSGGLVSAYIAAAVKARVTLVEAAEMGGDCLNTGCVPSKTLIRTARAAQQIREGRRYGLRDSEPDFSFSEVMQRVHEKIRAIAPHDSVERYRDLGVDVIEGYARLVDPWTVEIDRGDGDRQRVTSRSIVLATGAEPVIPAIPGIEQIEHVTSETLWDHFAALERGPGRLLVLGGGPVGCELAQALVRLDIRVTLVHRGARLLPREDEEVSELVCTALRASGVDVRLGCEVVSFRRNGDEQQALINTADAEGENLAFDTALLALGRRPRLSGYGLEELGVPTDGTVVTNRFLETLYPNIYAVGDVAGPYQFTHAAAHQAWYAAVNGLFGHIKRFAVDYRVLPWVTFVDPEVGKVGLNEREAKEQGVEYELTRYELSELDRAITEGDTGGFIKVLTVPGKDRILGATVVGAHAGELLAEFALAMRHGLGLNKLLGTVHSYPTWAEAAKYTAGEWKRAHAPQRLLNALERYHRWRLR